MPIQLRTVKWSVILTINLPHTYLHARYAGVNILQNGRIHDRQIVQIPTGSDVFLETTQLNMH